MNFNNDDQLKSYLKKESKRLGISITNTYTTFFSRILLDRVSSISFGELAVKGSFSELAHLNSIIRPITDIDLVSTKYHNDPLIILFKAMCETNDDINYELTDFPRQTKTGIYKIPIEARYGKIKHRISIDFMELSKTLYDIDYKRIDPFFSNDTFFYISTPTYEEHFAEKLCIIAESIKDDVLNTRVKDFYDIYKLYNGKYDLDKLSYYFNKMITDRNKINTNNLSSKHLNYKFIDNHKELWNLMSKKYEFMDKEVEFEEAFEISKNILDEQIKKYKTKTF